MQQPDVIWPAPFVLQRDEDASGVSGTGVVAGGVLFPDGTISLRWFSEWPTSVVFHDRGIEAVEKIHGHGGKTRIVWKERCPGFPEARTDKKLYWSDPILYHSPEEQGTQYEPGWYFITETWADLVGPFASEWSAEYALNVYTRYL